MHRISTIDYRLLKSDFCICSSRSFVDGENIGQIDIDSHDSNPFSELDELLLEFVCAKVAELYKN